MKSFFKRFGGPGFVGLLIPITEHYVTGQDWEWVWRSLVCIAVAWGVCALASTDRISHWLHPVLVKPRWYLFLAASLIIGWVLTWMYHFVTGCPINREALGFLVISAMAVWLFSLVFIVDRSTVVVRPLADMALQKEKTLSNSDEYVRFYNNRHALPGLLERLKGAGSVSVAWGEGQRPAHGGALSRSSPIERVILLDPEGSYIHAISKELGRSVDDIRTNILHTQDRANREARAEVRFFDGQITSTIIAKKDGWIAIDTNFPYLAGDKRPSYELCKDTHQPAFDEITDSYERLWEKSRRSDDPAPTTLSAKLVTANARLDTLTTSSEEKEKAFQEERKSFEEEKRAFSKFRRDQGLLILKEILGREWEPLNYTVSIQYMDLKDKNLAQKIRNCFGHQVQLGTNDPWVASEIEHILSRPNPSDARIVIFSDLNLAAGIRETLMKYELVDEPIATLTAGNYPGDPPSDISIVVFDE